MHVQPVRPPSPPDSTSSTHDFNSMMEMDCAPDWKQLPLAATSDPPSSMFAADQVSLMENSMMMLNSPARSAGMGTMRGSSQDWRASLPGLSLPAASTSLADIVALSSANSANNLQHPSSGSVTFDSNSTAVLNQWVDLLGSALPAAPQPTATTMNGFQAMSDLNMQMDPATDIILPSNTYAVSDAAMATPTAVAAAMASPIVASQQAMINSTLVTGFPHFTFHGTVTASATSANQILPSELNYQDLIARVTTANSSRVTLSAQPQSGISTAAATTMTSPTMALTPVGTPKDMVRQMLQTKGVMAISSSKVTKKQEKAIKEEKTPEQMQKLLERRERNKMAATRCRKKRRDRIDVFEQEVDALENTQAELCEQRAKLKAELEELEGMLLNHQCVFTDKSEKGDGQKMEIGENVDENYSESPEGGGTDATPTPSVLAGQPGTSVCWSRSTSVEANQ